MHSFVFSPNSELLTLNSIKIVPRARKGRVLDKADFGCLSGIPTLNLTNGCLFQCAYCYARGYSQAPQKGEVQLYTNLPHLLKDELANKRTPPEWVIINTSSDCFQPYPGILQTAYEVMEILLSHGIGISFLTKGEIPARFLALFKKFPGQILAQVGLVSLSDRYCKDYEPQAPAPELRLANVYKLSEIGILPEIRIDPIIPFLTDTEAESARLFEELTRAGVRKVTLSYLHLRPAIEGQLMKELPPLHRKIITTCFQSRNWNVVGSSTKTKLLPKIIREKGYQRMQKIAGGFGITAAVCQCKNPDLSGDLCGSARVRKATGERTAVQLPLFQC